MYCGIICIFIQWNKNDMKTPKMTNGDYFILPLYTPFPVLWIFCLCACGQRVAWETGWAVGGHAPAFLQQQEGERAPVI